MRKSARIRVPASTSNLGAGFDAVGLALQLYLTVDIHELPETPSKLELDGTDADLVPRDESNLIWQTMSETAAREGKNLPPFLMKVHNEIPITKGLGSSAAACLAGATAADFLCDLGFDRDRLLHLVTAREGHPDNVASALFGGLVVSISGERIRCARTAFPTEWTVVAVTPRYELETRRARAVLPAQIAFGDAVYNVQRAAFLMTQLVHGRREGLREAMRDRLHQPYRSPLVPGLQEILEIDDLEGLIGVALSGAGSTVVAFADSGEAAIGRHIQTLFDRHGLASEVRLLKADNRGLVVEALDTRKG